MVDEMRENWNALISYIEQVARLAQAKIEKQERNSGKYNGNTMVTNLAVALSEIGTNETFHGYAEPFTRLKGRV
jgi:muramoyltetrapeptide carboxypeptidase LdcA involved in peptidoglycan recycling